MQRTSTYSLPVGVFCLAKIHSTGVQYIYIMANPETAPDPEPLDTNQVIQGLEEVENTWNVTDLVSRLSPWVGQPDIPVQLPRDMFDQLQREMHQRFGIDLMEEIRANVAKAQELAEQNKSRLKKIGGSVLHSICDFLR